MEGFVAGDIIILDFPFTDLQSKKRRPAIVLLVIHDNLIIVPITSNLQRTDYCVPLAPQDIIIGELRQQSLIRTDFLITCAKSIVLYTAGRVIESKRVEVAERLCAMLRSTTL